jgi:membrane-bound lytic murein transglycosylase B
MFKRLLLCSLICLYATGIFAATPKINNFARLMAVKYHFKQQYLKKLLSAQLVNEEIIHKISFPYESKPWHKYRTHFVNDSRIKNGEKYWHKYHATLKRAKSTFGVSMTVIIAIIGIESNYGKVTHQFNELDALTTLAFHYKPRATFFTKELKQYFLLTREQNIDPRTIRGSYAGALGIPQFMPSSYRHYGVDFDKNKHVNLLTNDIDAIGSIGNYLEKNGWNRWGPIAKKVNVKGQAYKSILSENGKPKYTVSTLKKYGVIIPKSVHNWRKAALIKIGNVDPKFYLTFKNFSSIMSYNPRISYAMAVFQLSKALQKHHG